MKLYCANCGLPLHYYRKAIKGLNTIVDLIDYHECSESPIPFDITNPIIPSNPIEGKNKFVLELNELSEKAKDQLNLTPIQRPLSIKSKETFNGVGTEDLRDRRFESSESKSSAPLTILDQIKSMTNSIPVYDNLDPESEE